MKTLTLQSFLDEDKVQSNEAVFEGSNATEFLAHTLTAYESWRIELEKGK